MGTIKNKVPKSNQFQTLPERLKWLRQNMTPYMTQEQLAVASGVSLSRIQAYENGKDKDMRPSTMKKLASALGCSITIRLMRLSDREIMECQPGGLVVPPVLRQAGKISVEARTRALSRERSPWSVSRQQKRSSSRKSNA